MLVIITATMYLIVSLVIIIVIVIALIFLYREKKYTVMIYSGIALLIFHIVLILGINGSIILFKNNV